MTEETTLSALRLNVGLADILRDSERYRWIRANSNESCLYEHCGYEGSDVESMLSDSRLDAAIDAQMAANV